MEWRNQLWQPVFLAYLVFCTDIWYNRKVPLIPPVFMFLLSWNGWGRGGGGGRGGAGGREREREREGRLEDSAGVNVRGLKNPSRWSSCASGRLSCILWKHRLWRLASSCVCVCVCVCACVCARALWADAWMLVKCSVCAWVLCLRVLYSCFSSVGDFCVCLSIMSPCSVLLFQFCWRLLCVLEYYVSVFCTPVSVLLATSVCAWVLCLRVLYSCFSSVGDFCVCLSIMSPCSVLLFQFCWRLLCVLEYYVSVFCTPVSVLLATFVCAWVLLLSLRVLYSCFSSVGDFCVCWSITVKSPCSVLLFQFCWQLLCVCLSITIKSRCSVLLFQFCSRPVMLIFLCPYFSLTCLTNTGWKGAVSTDNIGKK